MEGLWRCSKAGVDIAGFVRRKTRLLVHLKRPRCGFVQNGCTSRSPSPLGMRISTIIFFILFPVNACIRNQSNTVCCLASHLPSRLGAHQCQHMRAHTCVHICENRAQFPNALQACMQTPLPPIFYLDL